MDYQKITNLLGNIPDKVPRFINYCSSCLEIKKNRPLAFKNNAPFISPHII